MQNKLTTKGEDVSDPDTLKSVQTAIRVNRSVRSIRMEHNNIRWTNVTTAIIEGAAQNVALKEVELTFPPYESLHLNFQMAIDEARQANKKLRLVVRK